MAVTARGLIGTGSATTAGTTITVTNTTGAVIPAGTFIHITGCWDNINSVTAPTITCSTVGGGTATVNHATAIGSGVTTTAGSGVWHQCFRVLTTGTIAAGATIATLTSNQSAVKRCAHAEGFNNCTTTLRGTVTTATSTSGAPSVTTTGTALVVGDLVIGSAVAENNGQMVGDLDTAGGTWSPIVWTFTTGGAAGTNVVSNTQYKILTATGTQTFNPTGGVLDTVACVYSLVPVPEPTFTQAAYRLYADGTETGSTALAAQDTAYEADVSGGDVNVQVRVRLQSTNEGAVAATDDYQLQYDRNGGGWTDVANPVITNLVPNPSIEVNTTGWAAGTNTTIARDSTRGGAVAASGSWALAATSVAAGNVTIQGVIGNIPVSPSTTYRVSAYVWVVILSNSVAMTVSYYSAGDLFISTSSAVNTTVLDAWGRVNLTITTPSNAASIRFSFVQGAIGATEKYWVDGVMCTAGSTLENYFDGTTAGASWSGTAHNSASTLPVPASIISPHASANLTDAAATTNRLGAGTGTFVAGKISEDGLVNDFSGSANNYTELLYSLTLKSADLADGDTLTFRVVRNGATTGFTYTQTPTIDIGGGVPTVTGTALITAAVTATVDGTPTTYGTGAASSSVDVSATGIRETFGTALFTITGNVSATVGVVVTTGTALISASIDTTVAGTVVAEVVTGAALMSSAVDVTAAGTRFAIVTGTALLTQSVDVTVAGTVIAEVVTGTALISSSVDVTAAGTVIAEIVTGVALVTQSVAITAVGTITAPGGGVALIAEQVTITAAGSRLVQVVTGTAAIVASVSVSTVGTRTVYGTVGPPAGPVLLGQVAMTVIGTVIAEVVSGTASITASVTIVVSVLKVYERAPYTATWTLLYMGTLEIDARATRDFDYAGGYDVGGRATVDHDYAHSWELV